MPLCRCASSTPRRLATAPDARAQRSTCLNAGDVVIFRGDLVHTGAAYDACNLSLHLYVDSPRAPHQRDAKATYAVDAKGGARAHWPIAE